MLVQNQKIEINTRRHDIVKYYRDKGYNAEVSVPFIVIADDLMPNSGKKIWVSCDYCGKIYQTIMRNYTRTVINGTINKCACINCSHRKNKEANLFKYGVENVQQVPRIQEKTKKTINKKYGVDNISKLPQIRQKAQKTCLERYGYSTPFQVPEIQEKLKLIRKDKFGVEYIFQSKDMREKAKSTCINKYGVSSPLESKDIQNKIQQKCLERYGCESPLASEEIQVKCSMSRFTNGTCHTSKTQTHLLELFDGVGNYPVGRYNVDMLLGNNIILEYDGGAHSIAIKYGYITQKEFLKKEQMRSDYLINKGYLIIRFINSNDITIADDAYIDALKQCKAKLSECKQVFYDFSTNKVIV